MHACRMWRCGRQRQSLYRCLFPKTGQSREPTEDLGTPISPSHTHTLVSLRKTHTGRSGWNTSRVEFYHHGDYPGVNLCWQPKQLFWKPYSQALPAICPLRQHPEISRQLITNTVLCNHLSWMNQALFSVLVNCLRQQLSLFWISKAHCHRNTFITLKHWR